MKIRYLRSSAIIAALVAGTAAVARAQAPTDTAIALTRVTCYVGCLTTRVVVTPQGVIHRSASGERMGAGRILRPVTAADTIQVPSDSVAAVLDRVRALGFADFLANYQAPASPCTSFAPHAPKMQATIRARGASKTVSFDAGCDEAPQAVQQSFRELETLAALSSWPPIAASR